MGPDSLNPVLRLLIPMDALEKILVVAVAFMAVACIEPKASETSDASGEASGLLL